MRPEIWGWSSIWTWVSLNTFETSPSLLLVKSWTLLKLDHFYHSVVLKSSSMLLYQVTLITVILYSLDYHKIYQSPPTCSKHHQKQTPARVLNRTRKYKHIFPALASLHWLPVLFRIDFKILLLVFKSLNGPAPSYIADLLTPYTLPRTLRSTDQLLLSVPRARLATESKTKH